MGKKLAIIGLCLVTAIAVLPFGSAMWTDWLSIAGSISIAKPPAIVAPLPQSAPNTVTSVASPAVETNAVPTIDSQPSSMPVADPSSVAISPTPSTTADPASADLVSSAPETGIPPAPTPVQDTPTLPSGEVQPDAQLTNPLVGASEPVAPHDISPATEPGEAVSLPTPQEEIAPIVDDSDESILSPAPTTSANTSMPPVAEKDLDPTAEVHDPGSPPPANPQAESTIAPTRQRTLP